MTVATFTHIRTEFYSYLKFLQCNFTGTLTQFQSIYCSKVVAPN